MNNLAIAYQAAGQHDFALPLSRETFERQRATLGPDSRNTLASMSNLALAHYRAGQYDQAVALYLETLEKQKSALASDHPDTLGTMTNLAQIYQTAGKFDLALPLFTEALEKQKTKLGANYRNPQYHVPLGMFVQRHRAARRGGTTPSAAVSGARLKFGVNHSTTHVYLEGLAQLNWRKGNFKESVSLYEELLRNAQKNQGADHLKSITAAFNLAANYHDAGRLAEAEKLIEEWLPRGRKLGFDDLCQQVAQKAASIYQRS